MASSKDQTFCYIPEPRPRHFTKRCGLFPHLHEQQSTITKLPEIRRCAAGGVTFLRILSEPIDGVLVRAYVGAEEYGTGPA